MKKDSLSTTFNTESSLVEKSPVSEFTPAFRDEKEHSNDISIAQLYQDWSEKQEYFHLGNSHFDLNY